MLNTILSGSSDTRPLVIAHGLFGSARNWGVLSKRLSETRPVITVDMRNHGASSWYDTHNYENLTDDLADVIRGHGGEADLLGHSMGGKAAMLLALSQPDLVGRLIVADISPVPYRHSQNHLIKAMRKVDLTAVKSRRDADQQLARWIVDDGVRAFLLQSLDLKGDAPKWRLNLDVLEAEMPAIVGFPEVAGTFERATLFLTGGASDYVPADHYPHIRTLFPSVTFRAIDGAGHWLHAENPRAFEAEVQDFLEG